MKLKRSRFLRAVLSALVMGLSFSAAYAASSAWSPIGPDGGDARRFAFDPRDPGHIYLGTTDSWIYVSSDGGSSWSRLARLAPQDDLVVDNLVVDRSDPGTLYAGVWVTDRPDGGVYISHDGGRTWAASPGMRGQSVRALTQSRSDPAELVAGTLSGVYRTRDNGAHWQEISPAGSTEIHEVESVAIDPYDPGIVYAGTWHLPWKTMDGGEHWISMKQGLIDDSDVFSIIVDPSRPSVVFASACSGIYRSDNFGDNFRKVQGIPSTARRTRVIAMDPADRNTVYAGTTEGLYKTRDGGENWDRTTGSNVIVNDVYIDPRNPKHVLLATDRSGVLASEDAGVTFQASNTGFSQRQVAALLADAANPGTMYAGVINDKSYGGVFVTTDFGRTWKQQSDGLGGRDVFVLAQTRQGSLLAGTSDGVFRWTGSAWTPDNGDPAQSAPSSAKPPVRRTRARAHRAAPRSRKSRLSAGVLRGRVNALVVAGDDLFAATPDGVYRSSNDGATWNGPILGGAGNLVFTPAGNYIALAWSGRAIFAARRLGMLVSTDRGTTWQPIIYPAGLTEIDTVAADPSGRLWVGGREGVFYTSDRGRTWGRMRQLPVADINSLAWDPAMNRVILTSGQSTVIFAVDPANKTWKWWNAGWTVHSVASLGGRLVAASMFSGIVAEPQPETASARSVVQSAQR